MNPSIPTDPATPDFLRHAPRPWWRRRGLWLAAVGLAAASTGATFWWQARAAREAAPVWISEPAARARLVQTVTANGTLQPTRTVAVGSELSGTVKQVLVDVNDTVRAGQVLVELDTDRLNDAVTRSQAALAAARAQLQQAQATAHEAQAALNRLDDVARLTQGQLPAATEHDTARANLARAQAAQRSAAANVDAAQASLKSDQTNLAKATLRSPISGVVLTRAVDPGNAVAASLQAVTLFTIAQDLRQMQLKVAIDEADVARVQLGQKASFTVSAFGARRFPATITRVSYGSTLTDNVVTYAALLDVANPDLSLRPGMTATATLVTAERDNALVVPNAALRYAPATDSAGQRSKAVATLLPRMPRGNAPRKAVGGAPKQVWVLRDGTPVPVPVTLGISDGRQTEVIGGELREGMAVITEQRSAKTP